MWRKRSFCLRWSWWRRSWWFIRFSKCY
jgi:hypothetical protein